MPVQRARLFAVSAICAVSMVMSQLVTVAAATPASAARGSGSHDNALLVTLKQGVSDAAAAALFKRLGASEVGRLDKVGVRVVVPERLAKVVTRQALRANAAVAAVEDDGSAQITLTPTDPLWINEWFARKVRAPLAWDSTIGAGGPVVAVLDTGVQFSHPDLYGRLLGGHDFVNDDSNPVDDNGHGTAVSGVVAGAGMNDKGIAGMCWRCRIMPLKVANSHGNVRWSNVAAAIIWAADRRVAAINMSFGGYTGSTSVADAITYARNRGVVVIAAAGNNGSTSRFYPAAYPGVLSVAATTSTDTMYSWSNRGSWVDLAAPGCTWTTRRGSSWSSFCGTSASAPIVAGIAGLIRAKYPDATRSQVETAITSTAVRVTAAIGGGRVDAAAAVGFAPAPAPDPTPEPTPTVRTCPNVDYDGAEGDMAWQGTLSATAMSVACTVKVGGWTHFEASWNAPEGIRLTLRNSAGSVVMELSGRSSGSDRMVKWLSRDTYRLTVSQASPASASFSVELNWRKPD